MSDSAQVRSIFITGGTGYMGRRLIPLLMQRGHKVKALVRRGSENKLPRSVSNVIADPLQMDSYTKEIFSADTFVHLIGVPHPSPAKATQFREVDLVSIRVAVKAARDAGIRHFIYLSVARPCGLGMFSARAIIGRTRFCHSSGSPSGCR
jgi:nucleoside-diphosphate-sugar epimerase